MDWAIKNSAVGFLCRAGLSHPPIANDREMDSCKKWTQYPLGNGKNFSADIYSVSVGGGTERICEIVKPVQVIPTSSHHNWINVV
jgi:hypothetical protein